MNTKVKFTEYEVLGKLPDLFVCEDGTAVKTPADWNKRRTELWRTAVELQYGTLPPKPEFLEIQPLYLAEISSYRIVTGRREKPVSFVMQVFKPHGELAEKPPVIVNGDACFGYWHNQDYLNAMLDQGVMFVCFNRTELANDIRGEGRRKGSLYETYPEYSFGAIGAWAWGYSRCVDALLKLELVNPEAIAFSGHSRGGKTAMLAGVLDERAAIVNPNDTCAGSCSCYRLRIKGIDQQGEEHRSEMLEDLWKKFGFWMGEGMGAYADDPASLPFDSHFLKAMVAPRTLFVSEAAHDMWANPLGSWQTTMAASEAFTFLGVPDNLLWYFRDGGHYHRVQDVQMLVNLIRHKVYGEPLHKDFFRRPFDAPPLMFDTHGDLLRRRDT